jgi:23S rRNA (guanosine2251-2'-O)-methyltransferase
MRKLKNEELQRVSVEEFKQIPKTPLIVVLDNIRSLNNIGSVFRTADAFLIEKVYLCGITATPPHKDIHKTALGATESVDWNMQKMF